MRLGGGRPLDDGVHGDGAVAADDDRVDVDGDDLGVGQTDVGDGDQRARHGVDVEYAPTGLAHHAADLAVAEQLVRTVEVERSDVHADRVQHLGPDAAESDDRRGAELRVALVADDDVQRSGDLLDDEQLDGQTGGGRRTQHLAGGELYGVGTDDVRDDEAEVALVQQPVGDRLDDHRATELGGRRDGRFRRRHAQLPRRLDAALAEDVAVPRPL